MKDRIRRTRELCVEEGEEMGEVIIEVKKSSRASLLGVYEQEVVKDLMIKIKGVIKRKGFDYSKIARLSAAQKVNVSRVSEVLSGKRNFDLRSLIKILNVLGFRLRLSTEPLPWMDHKNIPLTHKQTLLDGRRNER